MELIRGQHNVRPVHRGCVATIGNFDGVHLGHRAVLEQLARHARAQRLPSLVVVFEPQPREHFQGADAPARLTRFREKFELLAAAGVDRLLCVRFDAALAGQPAPAFVEQLLVEALGARVVVIGDDFRFGRGREGDMALMRDMGAAWGFDVEGAETFEVDGRRVSSTRVRDALAAGELGLAERLLGRPYGVVGRVRHGDRRGRDIGYPTVNIALHRHRAALAGIFAARVRGLDGGPHDAVAYVGPRPVVNGTVALVEAHVFDWTGECYGRHLHVDFLAKIRDDIAFDSFEAMRAQIDRDAARARNLLAGAPSP